MSEGVTESERYLTRLCHQSFLKLWSWPNLHKDQGGKEICDLLVVFDKHLLIFSDKDCEFPDTGDIQVDWSRWFRKAVLGSAKQVHGAERWLLEFPDRVFLDAKCEKPFPLDLPSKDEAIVHRIVVAHGTRERCIRHFEGGSGSLILQSDLRGKDHYAPDAAPFAIGDVDPDRGFVHVLDDVSLDIVMGALDTTTDFVEYLEKREELFKSSTDVSSTGEEELLALYLKRMEGGRHGFRFPKRSAIALGEGHWEEFQGSPERRAQIEENRASYAWDGLIETFAQHCYDGTQYHSNTAGLSEDMVMLQFLARESRFRRRVLAKRLRGALLDRRGDRMIRVLKNDEPGDPCYVFLVLKQPDFVTDRDEYRSVRLQMLQEILGIVKLRYPDVLDIIGIATEPLGDDPNESRSEDLAYLDARQWTPEMARQARHFQKHTGILTQGHEYRDSDHEYPHIMQARMSKGRMRNKPCTCGSGKKWKKCCGRSA